MKAMKLDLGALRSLVVVAEYETFGAAGTKLGMTQSAITQQMHRLEQTVGRPIFQKRGRNKVLTSYGRLLLGYARQITLIHDEAVQALGEHSSSPGILRIGTPHGIADNLLPRLLRNLSRYIPNVMMEVYVGRSPFLMEDLKRGALDLAISTRPDVNLDSTLLHVSPVVWMCSGDFVFSRDHPLPLILSDEASLLRRLILEALDERGIAWRQSFMAPTLTGVLAALRAGLGVTARNVELLSSDLRVLGENEGLPRLPDVSYFLCSRPSTLNPLVRQAVSILNEGGSALNKAM